MPVNDYLALLLTCTLTDAIVCLDTVLMCYCLLNTIIVIIIEFWDFSWSLLCYTLVSILVLATGITRGQYYWVLDIGCLSWYRSNPIWHSSNQRSNSERNLLNLFNLKRLQLLRTSVKRKTYHQYSIDWISGNNCPDAKRHNKCIQIEVRSSLE